ncbi:MAG: DUF952 domain-containing protein [Hyphomicrobium sp.]
MRSQSHTDPAAQTVYKVVAASDWKRACKAGFFTGSVDDVRDGFIHLSTAGQLSGTLARHFKNQCELLLIAFDAAALGEALRWELSRDGALFPHLYAPLPTALAICTKPIAPGADGAGFPDLEQPQC